MNSNLNRLFRPESIAVVGGGSWCMNVIQKCTDFGFGGPIWPVHRNKSTIAGHKAYANVRDLPAPPDATFIGVNRHATIEVVTELNTLGAAGAVCFASGFLEAENETGNGAKLQSELLSAASNMTLIGPNCYGFINYLDGVLLWPDQHGGQKTDTGVAILTQSSNIAINITMQTRGLPIGYVVTTGNQAQTGMAEIGMSVLADERVTALGIHIEGVGDLRAFELLAQKARKLGKPIVVLKVGRSQQSQSATISHTASLAGSNAGADALFQRLGIAQVSTLPEFLETLKLLHVVGPLPSNRLTSMSCSGGEASLIADHAVGHAVSFPALSADQHKKLGDVLGPMVKRANPLDYHTFIWADVKAMSDTFAAMMENQTALGLVILDFPRADRGDPSDWDLVIEAVTVAQTQSGRPIAIVSSLPENMPENVAERLVTLGITPICGLHEAITAAENAAFCGKPFGSPKPLLLPMPSGHANTLTEVFAKKILQEFGITTPKNLVGNSPLEAAQAALKIGFPVALKGLGIAHKTENGVVSLNLNSGSIVLAAANSMPCSDFLIEQMVPDSIAELLIGVVIDPAHGYVLTLGAGGTLTELLDDTASLLIPASRKDVQVALRHLNIWKLLDGFRGGKSANVEAIVDVVMAVQKYVSVGQGCVEEIEINPLICREFDAIAVDALIKTGDRND